VGIHCAGKVLTYNLSHQIIKTGIASVLDG